jgi:hypothetical protein
MEGKTFSFISVLLSNGKKLLEKLTKVIVVTTGKEKVSFTYVSARGRKRERVKQKKRDDEEERRIKK